MFDATSLMEILIEPGENHIAQRNFGKKTPNDAHSFLFQLSLLGQPAFVVT